MVYEITSANEAPELFKALDGKLKEISRENKGKKIDPLEVKCQYVGGANKHSDISSISMYIWGIDDDLPTLISKDYLRHVLECRACLVDIITMPSALGIANEAPNGVKEQAEQAINRLLYEISKREKQNKQTRRD